MILHIMLEGCDAMSWFYWLRPTFEQKIIPENALENIFCKVSAIVLKPQYINLYGMGVRSIVW